MERKKALFFRLNIDIAIAIEEEYEFLIDVNNMLPFVHVNEQTKGGSYG